MTFTVSMIPIGCLEKHGDHLPLGTDIAIGREVARRASLIEEFLIFPYYPFGFVSEVRHMRGTVSMEATLQYQILDQLCREIARSGCRKIVLGNAHGGNTYSLRAFAQSQLDRRCDYLVYVCDVWGLTAEQEQALTAKHGVRPVNRHGDTVETACMMAIAPESVHMERWKEGSGDSLNRLDSLEHHGIFTALNWYGSYPQQMAGTPEGASVAYGNDVLDFKAANLAGMIRQIKRTEIAERLLAEFYKTAENPGI